MSDNILIISSSYPQNIDTLITLITAVDTKWSTLQSAVSSGWQDDGGSTTHFPVDSVTGFATGGGYISVTDEIIYYSSASFCASSGVLHVPTSSRALFNTTASAHTSESKVEMRIVSEYHNRLVQGLINTQIFIGSSSVGAPTGQGGDEAWPDRTYITSGAHKIYSGTLEQRVRWLEWAIAEIYISGSSGSIIDGTTDTSGSAQLANSIWYT